MDKGTDIDMDRDIRTLCHTIKPAFKSVSGANFVIMSPYHCPMAPNQYRRCTVRCGLVPYSGSRLNTSTIGWLKTTELVFLRIVIAIVSLHVLSRAVRYSTVRYVHDILNTSYGVTVY
jgi:hypothetical protein